MLFVCCVSIKLVCLYIHFGRLQIWIYIKQTTSAFSPGDVFRRPLWFHCGHQLTTLSNQLDHVTGKVTADVLCRSLCGGMIVRVCVRLIVFMILWIACVCECCVCVRTCFLCMWVRYRCVHACVRNEDKDMQTYRQTPRTRCGKLEIHIWRVSPHHMSIIHRPHPPLQKGKGTDIRETLVSVIIFCTIKRFPVVKNKVEKENIRKILYFNYR